MSELDFNDPEIREHRSERLSRLGTNEAEHAYLHKTLDDAVAALQAGCVMPILTWLWLGTLTLVVIWLAVR